MSQGQPVWMSSLLEATGSQSKVSYRSRKWDHALGLSSGREIPPIEKDTVMEATSFKEIERSAVLSASSAYWKFIPDLFYWNADKDHVPCPLRQNYQLVRNMLAACVAPDRSLAPESGHAVLIYDERTPAFQPGGKGFLAFHHSYEALRYPGLLRKCSWQRLVGHLRSRSVLPWLTAELKKKYGL